MLRRELEELTSLPLLGCLDDAEVLTSLPLLGLGFTKSSGIRNSECLDDAEVLTWLPLLGLGFTKSSGIRSSCRTAMSTAAIATLP